MCDMHNVQFGTRDSGILSWNHTPGQATFLSLRFPPMFPNVHGLKAPSFLSMPRFLLWLWKVPEEYFYQLIAKTLVWSVDGICIPCASWFCPGSSSKSTPSCSTTTRMPLWWIGTDVVGIYHYASNIYNQLWRPSWKCNDGVVDDGELGSFVVVVIVLVWRASFLND